MDTAIGKIDAEILLAKGGLDALRWTKRKFHRSEKPERKRIMKRTMMVWISLGIGISTFTGCSTMEGDRGWGQDAGYPVQWDRVKNAAKTAALDPVTWVPAVGAAIFAIEDWDHKVSDWAVDNNPVFGSEITARDMSDDIRTALLAETFLTATLTPSGEDWKDWTLAKARGIGVEGVAMLATSGATSLGKDAVGRGRPNHGNDQSMPSAHASSAFSGSRLSNRNLDSIEMNPLLRHSLKAGNIVAASSVAWARVEGEKHYPADVLVGAALGNFITTFIHDAFINLPEEKEKEVGFYLEPTRDSVWAAISLGF
jgi:membrane-associated phospholipid phosphatase